VDLFAFFRRESAAPPAPYRNPEGGHTWYHGTPHVYEDSDVGEDHESAPSTPDRYESEYFEHAQKHWNSDLGSHWTSIPETARFFANNHQNGPAPKSSEGRIAHATLHMANPKHYPSEFDLAGEAVHWAKANGYRHLPDSPDAHLTFVSGHRFDALSGTHVDVDEGAMDHWASPTRSGNGQTEHVDYSGHPETGPGNHHIRKSISEIDKADDDVTGDEMRTIHGAHLDNYLGAHPFRSEIVNGFKKHLLDQGHDGITYGNEYEHPSGHICAVPFHDHHINLHKWEPLAEHDEKNYNSRASEVPGQESLVDPDWTPEKGSHWTAFDGKTAAARGDDTEEILRMLGVVPGSHWYGRHHTLAEESGAATHVPTASHDMPERKGFFPGEDLSGIDKAPQVGWVRTDAIRGIREFDRMEDPRGRENIARIREGIRKHGMTDPVIVSHDPHSDRAYLCEGNHRVEAAHQEGWPAVPVHVVRAFRSEADKMGRANYLGSHKVTPNEHNYTPGNLHPREALPDHWLYTGDDAGLRPRTATVGPEPKFQPPPEGLSDEEHSAFVEPQFQARRDWRRETRKALSRGHLSPQQAVDNGYHGMGHDSGSGAWGTAEGLGWKPLPQDLYHVTTDVKSVLAHGLKSRDDLGQDSGKGLGGGESDTISFTTDRHLAGSILESMHEFHQVVNGKKTIAHMWDEAKRGEGAARPFHEDLERHYSNRPGGVQAMIDGEHHSYRGGIEGDDHVKGMTPVEHGDHIETPKGTFHSMWKRPMTEDERRGNAVDFYKRFSAHREWAGGRPDPVFFSTDTDGFAKMDPGNFGILHARPKPGAHGYPVSGMGEWRTCDGSAVDVVHHQKEARWLPHDRIFGPGKGGLDPRLFDGRTKKMLPHVAAVILGDLDAYWHKTYPDWKDWTRVYLAGSEASEWYGNNDLDTLLGIEHKRLRKAHPEFESMLDDEIDAYLTKGLKEHLNDEEWTAPWDGQTWHRTYYVNPASWDIRSIKPYAAYDITRSRWIVEPVHPPSDWGPEKLPSAFWDEGEAILKEVDAILAMPEPYRTGRGAALFDYLHSDRSRAFGPHGTGVYDPGNAVWKYLDLHPDKPLSALIDLKRKYEQTKAREATA
jgi:hypothetical protein